MEKPTDDAVDSHNNPYRDAEFIIYQSTAEDVHFEPKTELGQETGIHALSFWARYEDEGREIPLFITSEQGSWLSFDVNTSKNNTDRYVSHEFVEAIAQLTDDNDAGWGNAPESLYEHLSLAEKVMVSQFQLTLIEGSPPPEVILVIEEMEERVSDD